MTAATPDIQEKKKKGRPKKEKVEKPPEPKNEVGRPPIEEPTVQHGLSLYERQWQWLTVWHEGNRSDQARAFFEHAMKFWPNGPNLGRPKGAKNKPGGVRELKKLQAEIQQLKELLDQAGIKYK